MNIENMREYISNAYPGRSWKARCNTMSTQQVVAVYYSIMNRKKPKPKVNRGKSKSDPGYQFTIYDVLKEENK